jgi:hypothetical protein
MDPAAPAVKVVQGALPAAEAREEVKEEGRAAEVAPVAEVLVGVVYLQAAAAEGPAEVPPGGEADWPASP